MPPQPIIREVSCSVRSCINCKTPKEDVQYFQELKYCNGNQPKNEVGQVLVHLLPFFYKEPKSIKKRGSMLQACQIFKIMKECSRIPISKPMADLWVHQFPQNSLKSTSSDSYICSNHFTPDSFQSQAKGTTRRLLKLSAIPSPFYNAANEEKTEVKQPVLETYQKPKLIPYPKNVVKVLKLPVGPVAVEKTEIIKLQPKILRKPQVLEKPQVIEKPQVLEKPQVIEKSQVLEKPQVLVQSQVMNKPQVLEKLQILEKPQVLVQSQIMNKPQDLEKSKVLVQSQVMFKPEILEKLQVLKEVQILEKPQVLVQSQATNKAQLLVQSQVLNKSQVLLQPKVMNNPQVIKKIETIVIDDNDDNVKEIERPPLDLQNVTDSEVQTEPPTTASVLVQTVEIPTLAEAKLEAEIKKIKKQIKRRDMCIKALTEYVEKKRKTIANKSILDEV